MAKDLRAAPRRAADLAVVAEVRRTAETLADLPTMATIPRRETASFAKVSVNLNPEIAERLRRLAFENKLSGSAVVEAALYSLFDGKSDAVIAAELKANGAQRRRSILILASLNVDGQLMSENTFGSRIASE